ncbi:uncharacterized protein TrAFT101_011751 [Trichoderma asperellum]|uniref:uncharacterized protein n=1 Tax=Trichoderma asperellum TaxID=101201 RepID=UPI0033253727|nr:hypothetical protein TrAFT101_011751 [Trichoderma asperellum]
MPESRVAVFLGVDIGITMLALGVVVLRVVNRWSRGRLAISDYLVSIAMLAAIIHMILDIIITARFGYARHQKDLPPSLQGSYKTSLMFWLIQIFTKLPLLFSKLSLTFVYHDLMDPRLEFTLIRISRAVNYFLMVVIAGFFTAATLVSMFACNPIYKSWLPKTPGKCIDTTIMFNYVTSGINIFTSACLICIPLPVLYLSKNKGIEVKQLTALVLFGLIDTAISIIRLRMIADLQNVKKDFTWLIIPTHIIIVVEMNITIIAASVVVMRPAFKAIFEFFLSLRGSHKKSSNEESISSREQPNQEIRVVREFELASENDSKEHILLGNL